MSGHTDRIKAGIETVVRQVMAGVDYHALYPSEVLSQNADGTLELKPDATHLPAMSEVPLRHAFPGVTAKVAAGARVLVGFENGEPNQPVALLWEMSGLTSLHLGGSSADGSDAAGLVAVAARVESAINSLVTTFNAHTHVVSGTANPGALTVAGTAAAVVTPASSASGTGTSKVKVSG